MAMVLATLDNMIVSTAMPTIVADIGGFSQLSWVVTAYTLATAASTPIWGKLGDMYGRKGVFVATIVVFLLGSGLAGTAGSMAELVAYRAVQGAGAGGLMVSAFAIVGELIPSREIGRYQGLLAAVMGATMVAGPLVGGLLTDTVGWRWCFFVNLPLGAVALLLVTTLMRLPRRRGAGRIDYPGAALLVGVIVPLVLIASWGGTTYPWGSSVIAALAVTAVLCGVGFLLVERRAAEPVLPLHLFARSDFTLITVVGCVAGFVLFGALTFLPLFQQGGQGISPTDSGLLLLPVLLPMVLVNLVGGRFIARRVSQRPFVITGAALSAASLAVLAQLDAGMPHLVTGAAMAGLGFGTGLLMQTTILVSMANAGPEHLGVASSTATLFRTLGGSFGVSVMGAVFTARVHDVLVWRAGAAAADGVVLGEGGHSMRAGALPAAVRAVYGDAVTAGVQRVFLLSAVIGLVALVAAWFLRRTGPPRTAPAQADVSSAV
jgi:EmrB/QacA subfamily drug resistance transporter